MIVLYITFTQLNQAPTVKKICTLQAAYAAIRRALSCDCCVEQALKLASFTETVNNIKLPVYTAVLS